MPGPPDHGMDQDCFAWAHLLHEMREQVAAPAKLFAEGREKGDKQEYTHPGHLSTRHMRRQTHCSQHQVNTGGQDPEENGKADHRHEMPRFPPTPTDPGKAIPKDKSSA